MPLVRGPNGKLMRGPNGKLLMVAPGYTCPCECVDGCTACCVKLTGGTLAEGVIEYFAFEGEDTLEFTITTESGTRQVCGDQTITITMSNPGTITFDPAWEYVSSSPEADDFQEYPSGYVVWEGGTNNSVTLKLRNCFFYGDPSLGALSLRNGEAAEVVGIDCIPDTPCCTIPRECEPCCYSMFGQDLNGVDVVNYTPPFDWHWNANSEVGGRFEHLEFSNGVWFMFWVKPPDGAKPSIFCKDEELQIGLVISSEDPDIINQIKNIPAPDPGIINVSFLTDEFEELPPTFDPATATVEPAPDTITWTEEKSLKYQASIKFNCDNPGQEAIVLSSWIDLDGDTVQSAGDPAVTTTLRFEYCGDENDAEGCPCGCPCCEGGLPETISVSFTYNEVDYQFDLGVTRYECDSPAEWWLIEPTEENPTPNCGPCATTAFFFALSGCQELPVWNIQLVHICSGPQQGWVLSFYFESLTSSLFFGPESKCQLPATGTLCDVEYTLEAGV